ncbi:oxidoreductase [Halalkalibacter hemicellulosilyticus]|uniref:N-ethylmaleimide reductase n=1 Tax=Halalkalibacter hemicellulosilyticusJCM 9152 TaxID=1236971 RepID=W4QIL4_9BACI|nr:oxidoreductase [Halalkalibacter hemicellulosilyticus]GAE31950.1 N-ethylmaleimide reductase [Halalkalibacter hemicellulosilyticusJCM 9152]
MELLTPFKRDGWQLQSRAVMAPMTRGFADFKTGIIHPDTVSYYQRRAQDGIGMIVTEGIAIAEEAKGTVGIPGLYTDEQTEAWKEVTDSVHQEGGKIIAQLWHVGRLSHSYFTNGRKPLAPSSIKANGHTHRVRLPYEMPNEMTVYDIRNVIKQFVHAAYNAIKAGFDGVEIHAAHGYLIDQFHSTWTNIRKDRYGQNRYLFLEEILLAVGEAIGTNKIIVRFSEHKDDSPLYAWEDPEKEIQMLIEVFHKTKIELLHPSVNEFSKPLAHHSLTLHELVRKYWDKIIIGVGNLTSASAEKALKDGLIDLAAFGRPLLANSDFMHRTKASIPLKPYDSKIHLQQIK